MKNPLRWCAAAALCAASSLAQAPTAQERLARAQLLASHEHDLAGAQAAYRALLDDAAATAVHGDAALQLGALLWRLDQHDAAKPFLDRAVAAGGDAGAAATAILQGQGDDAKQAQQRLEKARALVALYADLLRGSRNEKGMLVDDPDGKRTPALRADLHTLGMQGAAAVGEYLDTGLANGSIAEYPGTDPVRQWLVALLWQIGTEPASEYLQRASTGTLARRRAIAQGIQRGRIAPDLEPTFHQYLRDPDASDEVWRLASRAAVGLPIEKIETLVASPEAPLRAAGLEALASNWPNLSGAQQDEIVGGHAATIADAARSADLRVAKAASSVLGAFATGPTSASLVFLANADRYTGPRTSAVRPGIVADDAWLHAAAASAQRLADLEMLDARPLLTNLLGTARHVWTRAAVDDVVRLVNLGYAGAYAHRGVELADDSQLPQVIAVLPKAMDMSWVHALQQRKLAASAFPPLREVTEQWLAGQWTIPNVNRGQANRTVGGRSVVVETLSEDMARLLILAGTTGAPEAATWLGELVDRHPTAAPTCVNALARMVDGPGGPAALASLRKLLVWPGTSEDELQANERSIVFSILTRTGDADAIPLFARAYELGLARTSPRSWLAWDAHSEWGPYEAAGIGWLCERISARNESERAWHRYSDADLLRAWTALLDATIAPRALADFSTRIDPATGVPNGRKSPTNVRLRVPLAVLPAVLERLPRLLGTITDPDARNEVLGVLAWQPMARLTAERVQADAALRRTLSTLLRHDDVQIADLLQSMRPEVAALFPDEGRELLFRSMQPQFLGKLVEARIPLSESDWQSLLAGPQPMRVAATQMVPPAMAHALRNALEANLRYPEAEVRKEACYAVRRTLGSDGVALLLPMLQDPHDTVRGTARACLDDLREEYERRAFWSQAQNGIDTSPAGATAKLLAQAQPQQEKAQRLLALRSLAVLGAPTALPYLIDWTKDADAEIAAAAREAIARIHATGGTPPAPAGNTTGK